MKIGILTMHRIQNYGSFLQAFALKKIIEDIGYSAEFVDYHVEDCLISSAHTKPIARKFIKVKETMQIGAPIKEKFKFIRYKKNYAKNYYPYLGITDEYNYNPKLDLLIIGSDEVFNCVQNNTNVGYSKELFGYNSNAKHIISYAASFGDTTIEKLNKYKICDEISAFLKKFDSISVRDANSAEIVKNLTGANPLTHLDPVLMYDFIGKCSEIPDKMTTDKYMILYGYSGRFTKEECSEIRNYADKNKLKIYCIGGVQSCCDNFIDCSPFEVISYFKNAQCVVTDTFHGTILSVITHRNFVAFVREKGYGNSQKLKDLLVKLKLIGRIANSKDMIEAIFSIQINYAETDTVILSSREKTYRYLSENSKK